MSTALREVLARFGFEIDDSKLKGADSKVNEFTDKLKDLAKVVGAGYLISKIGDFVDNLRGTASELRNTSQRLGMSVQDWQRWKFAAELAGVSGEELATGIRFLQRNLADAASGGKETSSVFKKLGVTTKDAAGNAVSGTDALRETGLAIAGISNPTERTAAALKVFGRAGTALLPFFNKGAAGVEDLLGELDRLGGGLDDNAIKKLAESSKASKRFDMSLMSMKAGLATALVPALTKLVDIGTKVVVAVTAITAKSEILKAGFIAVTAAIIATNAASIVAAGAMILSWLPVIATVVLAALAVDDLLTYLKGGKSVIGDFFEFLLGTERMAQVRSGGDSLGNAFAQAIWRGIKRSVNFIIDLIGTIFTGAALVDGAASEGEKMGQDFINAVVRGAKAAVNALTGAIGIGALFDTTPTPAPQPAAKVLYDVRGNPLPPETGPTKYDVRGNPYHVPAEVPTGAGRGFSQAHVEQTNHIQVNVDATGSNGQGVAAQTRDGVKGALNDDRRQMVHDLETVAPSSMSGS